MPPAPISSPGSCPAIRPGIRVRHPECRRKDQDQRTTHTQWHGLQDPEEPTRKKGSSLPCVSRIDEANTFCGGYPPPHPHMGYIAPPKKNTVGLIPRPNEELGMNYVRTPRRPLKWLNWYADNSSIQSPHTKQRGGEKTHEPLSGHTHTTGHVGPDIRG
jgi:hypothetical protein